MTDDAIIVEGVRQNNLKNLSLRIERNALTVVTGVSGSGKSSLAFDTVYAEGQRRYVETFSPYARQFLDRMDRPRAERIDGIPPAIAIDQTNPVRTSRSTVGTMTELNDLLKLLFARAGRLHCRGCARAVRRDTSQSIRHDLMTDIPGGTRVLITFSVDVPASFSIEEVRDLLAAQGYTRIHRESPGRVEVIQDRVRIDAEDGGRLTEALEAALGRGRGRLSVWRADDEINVDAPRRYSAGLHCADCDIDYREPMPSLFSFNSPIGACEACRGFGRTIGIDYDLVVPDQSLSLAGGAIRPWRSESYKECQRDLLRFAKARRIPVNVPWRTLDETQRQWVLEGEGDWEDRKWYGVRRFFAWLETKAYRMHIRVLLSRYRAYAPCTTCNGARLKPEPLWWRLGDGDGCALAEHERFVPADAGIDAPRYARLAGAHIHELLLLPVSRCREFFEALRLPAPLDKAADHLLEDIRARLRYLGDVGLDYLCLDRQSRTLSGGEVQRINLTTALGTSLVNTLFVLDEPSIGLHARDMARVIAVLHRLRDAGNTLLVVEHDAQIMLAADRVLDMGPGPGDRGGTVVFDGTPAKLLRAKTSLTGDYLSGRRRVAEPARARRPKLWLEVRGAAAQNLKDVDVRIPLNRFVCITGVSGSGKSTLIEEVLHRALRRHLGKPTEAPGTFAALRGAELVDDVVLVDQSPIGRTTRSNPASYVGAWDAIRKRFAADELARSRGYTAGTFSFNAGSGRCPACGGNGFEHVEMQFLSDVYLRCAQCNGRRYRDEVLEVRIAPSTQGTHGRLCVADVLDLTVDEAVAFFATDTDVLRGLEPLQAVGLGYLRLGQPVPTLSGGEAQRLKLAGHLAERRGNAHVGGTLFLFDEPTTGLHFDDIATLLRAFHRLIDVGHSLVVIEHNIDLIAAAEWIVDLGPEGGDAGGRVVATGTPANLVRNRKSHTAAALRMARGAPVTAPARRRRRAGDNVIAVRQAREHNLKSVDVNIPRDRLTVVTGLSGSGKSTLAFDIVFAEGQRRYLESLNAYARQFVQPASRPDVDAVLGIPPSVAIEQRTSRGGRKSTVATLTEIHHFLRLLYVRLGTQHCVDCDLPIEPQSEDAVAARILREFRGRAVTLLAPLVVRRKGYYTELARWAAARGFTHLRVDGVLTPVSPWPRLDRFREHDIELVVDSLRVDVRNEAVLRESLARTLDYGKGVVRVAPGDGSPGGKRRGSGETLYSTRRACPGCGRSYAEPDPRLFSYNSSAGWCTSCFGTGVELRDFDAEHTGEESPWLEAGGADERACGACGGARLKPEALAVRFAGRSIAELSALNVTATRRALERLKLDDRAEVIAQDVLAELRSRLAFLEKVGLDYLALDRGAPTLSGGEAQRIRLAAQLGSSLRGVCYVLDEPTIGLHPRDNRRLLDTLMALRDRGNTLIVVEHDDLTIRSADHVIDLGPGAGSGGGELVAQGSPADVMASPRSVTGHLLREPLVHPLGGLARRRVARSGPAITIEQAVLHNLRGINVRIPLDRLICVTGVSGSGKSTLVRDVLYDNLHSLTTRRRGRMPQLRGCQRITGWESVRRVLEVDQAPIGKTPRSCPATYVGIWDAIRRLFAATPEARVRGYSAARFSFNVAGGRCETCEGQGMRRIEMNFLPDVRVNCEDCHGERFAPDTLAIEYRGRSIADVLAMSIDEAVEFFAAHAAVRHSLGLLRDCGLGYLTLGQQSPTLSGGEAQRLKLVSELARAGRERRSAEGGGGTLYVLDEPTVGLHMGDVEKLIRVLHRLVDGGNTVVVIEHDLDVIAEADWVVDLGPEGGDKGGRVVAQGPAEKLMRSTRSHTGAALRAATAMRADVR